MSMSPPPENEPPLGVSRRPTSLTVISIMGIVIGALGVSCVGGMATIGMMRTDPTMEHAPPWFLMLNIGMTTVSVIISMLLLIGSIGLLNLKSWARTMMLVLAWVDLIFDTGKLIVSLAVLPALMRLFETYPPPNVQPQMLSMIRIFSIVQAAAVFLGTSAFAIALLIVLTRPKVKSALMPPEMPALPAM